MSDLIERAVKTYAKAGQWPDTVHLVWVDHLYGPGFSLEFVQALCNRKGTGQTPYPSAHRCKTCQRINEQTTS